MSSDLTQDQSQQPQIPPDVLSSLLSRPSSSKAQPELRAFVSIDGGAQSIADDKGKNAVHLHCPREGCGSLILRKGDGELKMGSGGMYDSSGPFPPPPASLSSASPSSPSSDSPALSSSSSQRPAQAPFWLISNSPFGFENAGFSRNVPHEILSRVMGADLAEATGGAGHGLKYVTCAECDMGPVGWSIEGGKEAWLGVERVRYGV